MHPDAHTTYLHAGSSKGWPADHTVEDTFDVPHEPRSSEGGYFFPKQDAPEYAAEFTGTGGAILVLYPPSKIIAHFDTMADAKTAAEALNNHKGY